VSAEPEARRGIKDIRKGGAPLVCLTAYTAPVARLVDPYVDVLLVGDSLGMVIYGFADTLSVTLEMMINHGAAVMRSTRHAFVIVDMPFGSYETSREQALTNARRVMNETGCQAVKCEGGAEMADTIRHLVENGVPVAGHVGLMPQSIKKMGGFKIQGRDDAAAEKVVRDAEAIAGTGAFAIVIEGTVEPLARRITSSIAVPAIGIGASPACDGQILVIDDVIGFTQKPPRFAKVFGNIAPGVEAAVKLYADDVRGGRFPGPEHCYVNK
jgi:3-methyl-2-oxobutanoate hydroxymethyltransferase